jgi:hypothetical protein
MVRSIGHYYKPVWVIDRDGLCISPNTVRGNPQEAFTPSSGHPLWQNPSQYATLHEIGESDDCPSGSDVGNNWGSILSQTRVE